MLERIIENWLTRAGEKGYQIPFAQVLSIEGHRVLHGPAHHPFEHGKDIVTVDGAQRLCAFQLKGRDQSLADIEAIQPQLLALASGAITYPGVEPPRRPDRVTLVVSGVLTPPARDRIENFNHAHRSLGIPAIDVVEKEHLVTRFVAAQGQYLPTDPIDLNRLLKFYLVDGRSPFPVHELLGLLTDVVTPKRENPPHAEFARAIGSSLLLTAYAAAPWQRVGNHLPVAEAWLALSCEILRVASENNLPEANWRESYDLAFAAARGELRELLDEAAAAKDLIIPDLVEGVVYPTRALVVCGYLAAFFLSEREQGHEEEVAEPVKGVLLRELPYIKVVGETAGSYVLAIGTALDLTAEREKGRLFVARYAVGLARANQDHSEDPLPDPYHSFEDCLKRAFGAEVESPDEQFAGSAYTLHVVIDWLGRRGERPVLENIWPLVTRLTLCEFRPSRPSRYLSPAGDDDGILHQFQANTRESWGRLRLARELSESELPQELWRHLELLPYVCLLLPYRLTSTTSKALDYMVQDRAAQDLVAVSLDVNAPGELSGVGDEEPTNPRS